MNQLEILLKLKNETQAGFAQLEKSVESVKKQTESLTTAQGSATAAGLKFGAAAGIAAAAFQQYLPVLQKVGSAFLDMSKEFAAAGGALTDLKKQTGVGVVEMQQLQFAAKQTGVDVGGLTQSVVLMERSVAKSPEKFKALGLELKDLKNASPVEMLSMMSSGFKSITDENERTRIAMDIFGRSGSNMLKLLMDDFDGLTEAARGTGLMTEEMAAKGDRLDDAFSKLDTVVQNLRINLGAAFVDSGMITGMETMADAIGLMAENADLLAMALEMVSPQLSQLGAIGDGIQFLKNDWDKSGFMNYKDKKPGKGALAEWERLFGKGSGTLDIPESTGVFAPTDALKRARAVEAVKRETERLYEVEKRLIAQREAKSGEMAFKLFELPMLQEYARINSSMTGTMPGIATSISSPWLAGAPTKRGGNDPFAGVAGAGQGLMGDPTFVSKMHSFYNDSDAAQEKARESAARWAGALQGVALIAGAIGGKLGDTVGVMGNIARSFEDWGKPGFNKFNAVAGGVGQIGGLVGGSAGAGIQGGAGGAMLGNSLASALKIAGPWGAIAGGAIGLIGGLFGNKSKEKKELADMKGQLETLRDSAKALGVDLTKAFASKNINEVKSAIEAVNKAAADKEKRAAGLASAASGFNTFVGGGGVTDQASANRSSLYATAIFGGMVKDTGDVAAALQAISPALSELAKKADEMGLSLGAGVSNLIGMSNVLSANEGLAGQVSGLNQMMKGLSDAGMMNKDLFAALGADASAVFGQLIAGGASGNQALALMQPTLQQLYEGQKLHGYVIDENTQKLLDEAEAQGIVGDAFMSANERMVELLAILVETLGGTLPDAYKRAGDAAEEYGRRATSSIPTAPGGPSGDDGRDAGYASGTAFRDFGAGTRTTLHGREAVMTPSQVDRLVSMAVSGAPGSTVPQGDGQPIVVHVMMDGEVMGTAMARTIQRGGPAGQAILTELAGRS